MFTERFTVCGSSLKLLKAGEQGVVTRIHSTNPKILQKLRTMGIAPGKPIALEERFPRFVVRLGGDRVILDEPTIQAIYVRMSR